VKRLRLFALAAAAIGIVVLAPCATVLVVPADEPVAPEIAPKLAAAKHAIVHGLDRGWTRARYIGLETRASDQLVVLRFEIYGWPNLVPTPAYLSSRCRSLAEIDPGMYGRWGRRGRLHYGPGARVHPLLCAGTVPHALSERTPTEAAHLSGSLFQENARASV
jgi:hypothetical protein